MKNIIIYLLLIIIPFVSVNASDQSDTIRKHAEQAALNAMSQELVKKMIDIGVKQYVVNTAGQMTSDQVAQTTDNYISDGVSVGGAVLAIYNIANSMKDFFEADHDQQKLYSAASATSSALLLYSNPVGWVIAAALLAQSFIDAGYTKRLASIQAQTLEHWKHVLEIRTDIATAQWHDFAVIMQTAAVNSNKSTEMLILLRDNCSEENLINTVKELEKCSHYAINSVHHLELSLRMTKRLFVLPANDFNVSNFLVVNEKTSYEFLQDIKSLETKLVKLKEISKNLIETYSKYITSILIETAKQEGFSLIKNKKYFLCEKMSLAIPEQSIKLRLSLMSKTEREYKLAQLQKLYLNIENFLIQDCESLIKTNNGNMGAFDILRREKNNLLSIINRM